MPCTVSARLGERGLCGEEGGLMWFGLVWRRGGDWFESGRMSGGFVVWFDFVHQWQSATKRGDAVTVCSG